MAILHNFIALLYFISADALELSKTTITLDFISPGFEPNVLPTISTKLSMTSPASLTAYKSIRSILHINNIIMDCSFNFDSNILTSSTKFICDINTACITSLNSENEMLKIHFENLGVGDLQISEIEAPNQILYNNNNNNLLCIGDSKTCNNKRYIQFKSTDNMNKLYPIISEMHPKATICNPKNFIYNNQNGRKLLVSHLYNDEVYGNAPQYTGNNTGHAQYMDVILTIVFLILIVISVFNMSYAFNYDFKPKYIDTRRV